MRKILFLFLVCLLGCGQLTVKRSCGLIQKGLKFGVKIGLDKLKDKKKISFTENKKTKTVFTVDLQKAQAVVDLIRTKILPKLQGKDVKITRKDLDIYLALIGKKMPSNKVKEAVQLGIEQAFDMAPPMPKSGSVGRTILDIVVCVFQGIAEGFSAFIAENKPVAGASKYIQKKTVKKPVKLSWD